MECSEAKQALPSPRGSKSSPLIEKGSVDIWVSNSWHSKNFSPGKFSLKLTLCHSDMSLYRRVIASPSYFVGSLTL